jgi:site-specific recombinase XerD
MHPLYKERILREMQVKGWSLKTQSIYLSGLDYFMRHFKGRKPNDLSIDDIKIYCQALKNRGCGPVWTNMQMYSIKFFYKHVVKPKFDIRDIPRLKVAKRFPKVLSRQEIKTIIAATRSIKEKAILSVLYSAGLRVNELVNLKIQDIDSKQMLIHVRCAKGNKQRYVPLSKNVLLILREYWQWNKRKSEYLFAGPSKRQFAHGNWIGMIFRRAKKSPALKLLAPATA